MQSCHFVVLSLDVCLAATDTRLPWPQTGALARAATSFTQPAPLEYFRFWTIGTKLIGGGAIEFPWLGYCSESSQAVSVQSVKWVYFDAIVKSRLTACPQVQTSRPQPQAQGAHHLS